MRYVRNGEKAFIQWKDRHVVSILSTIHSATDSVMSERHTKVNGQHQVVPVRTPAAIADYNRGMGAVDMFDQHVAAYRILRRCKKYWRTIFCDYIEVALVNSYVLFTLWCDSHPGQISRPSEDKHFRFRISVVREHAGIQADEAIPIYKMPKKPAVPSPILAHMPRPSDRSRNCYHCYRTEHIERKVTTFCEACMKYLHVNHFDCFFLHHQHLQEQEQG